MQDKDKLWLVISVATGSLKDHEVRQMMAELRNCFKYDESVNTIIIPTKSDTKISFYNMGNMDPNTIDEVLELIDELKKKLNEEVV
jgi:predicted metal-dependent peptidase